jgi:hypothetical protein
MLRGGMSPSAIKHASEQTGKARKGRLWSPNSRKFPGRWGIPDAATMLRDDPARNRRIQAKNTYAGGHLCLSPGESGGIA